MLKSKKIGILFPVNNLSKREDYSHYSWLTDLQLSLN